MKEPDCSELNVSVMEAARRPASLGSYAAARKVAPYGALTLLALLALTGGADAAEIGATATWDTAGSVESWTKDNSRVTVSNPEDYLQMSFLAQYGPPSPEWCRVYSVSNAMTGDYVAAGIGSIGFRFKAENAAPSAMWLSIRSGVSGNEWFVPLEVAEVGSWKDYSISLAYGAGWYKGPEQTEAQYEADLRNVTRVGVYVRRSSIGAAERYCVDDFGLGATLRVDSDRDGMTDGAESAAGTDPLNPASRLRVRSEEKRGSGIIVKWDSVEGKVYGILRTSSMFDAFVPIASGIPATAPENTYIDTTTVGNGPYFYKVRVEP